MDINAAYRDVGTYRGAADICGTTAKTVKRAVLAAEARAAGIDPVHHNYDAVRDIVVERVAKTKGRISAKRLPRWCAPPATPGRPETSAAWWPTRSRRGAPITIAAGGPACGRRETCWS